MCRDVHSHRHGYYIFKDALRAKRRQEEFEREARRKEKEEAEKK